MAKFPDGQPDSGSDQPEGAGIGGTAPGATSLAFSDTVPYPAAQVWAVIGDFGAISRWARAVTSEQVETVPEGTFRTITLKSGQIFRERLVESGPRFYTYSVDRRGTDQYEATIAVEELEANSARIFLTVCYLSRADTDAEALAEEISIFFRGCLKAMKRALQIELSLPFSPE